MPASALAIYELTACSGPSLNYRYALLIRQEQSVNDIVANLFALRQAFGFVEGPVNAEVNSALSVFFFGLR
jgi:hypothetical protein